MLLEKVNWFEEKISLRRELFSIFLDEQMKQGSLFKAIEITKNALKKGNKIVVFGNGGSATQASHLAAELINKFYFERKGLPALALTTDVANITSIANDSDFKYIFARQLEALGQKGDTVIGITTGGVSVNVLEAFKMAKKMKLDTVALCGQYTAALEELGVDLIIPVKSKDTPLIQEMHLFILHTMAEVLEQNFFGGKE
ncbi:MAG: SIS domain-containing protein [Acidobacteria bacterium]|jgi:D-sedoheptulose 7-phosphate isomerase|nr:SIS domain-containing protein [Acidobacteriota bacterium]